MSYTPTPYKSAYTGAETDDAVSYALAKNARKPAIIVISVSDWEDPDNTGTYHCTKDLPEEINEDVNVILVISKSDGVWFYDCEYSINNNEHEVTIYSNLNIDCEAVLIYAD